jgi:hypothetical protein
MRKACRAPPSVCRQPMASSGTGTNPHAVELNRCDGFGSAGCRRTVLGGTPRDRRQALQGGTDGGAPWPGMACGSLRAAHESVGQRRAPGGPPGQAHRMRGALPTGHGQVEHGRIAERHQGTDGVEYGESTAQIRVDADVQTDAPSSHVIALCRAPLATAASPSQSLASPGYPGGTHRWENSG